ncbi:MAG: hypothetical protein NW241_19345 [Bacteroidia bacterium]|nr:hypothetical protein [Bacteroidia bacterium]
MRCALSSTDLRAGLLVLLLALYWGHAAAQPLLLRDAHPGAAVLTGRPSLRSSVPDTLQISAAAPFIDDFAYRGPEPDSQRWFVPPQFIDVPRVQLDAAADPPTFGAAMFDGATRSGAPYLLSSLGAGLADRLFSHYIDLSAYSPADSVRLTLFLQPQGRGEAPEGTDSFRVSFRAQPGSPSEFVRVLKVTGSSLRPFRQYSIPLLDPAFFHATFQMRFESFGSLNGKLDQWALDYVYLGVNRRAGDTTYIDLAPVRIESPPLGTYTAIPLHQYNGSPVMTDWQARIRNFSASPLTANVSAALSDPVGNTAFSPVFIRQQSLSLAPLAMAQPQFLPFSDQAFAVPGVFDLALTVASPTDTRLENNTLPFRMRIDSLLAYDDGEADATFGLNQTGSFGIRVDLDAPDTLTALWAHFVPSLYYNPVNSQLRSLENQPFRIVVWGDPHPDSILFDQLGGVKVQYAGTVDGYVRYAFSRPVNVPARFWIGIQQQNEAPLGLGYDLSYDRDALSFWDSLGTWKPLRLNGALMIRPEFYRPGALPAAADAAVLPAVRLMPNPLTGREIRISGLPPGGLYRPFLMDLQGRICWEAETGGDRFELPAGLLPGLYLWGHRVYRGAHAEAVRLEKLIIR